jgi:hypothetical protein
MFQTEVVEEVNHILCSGHFYTSLPTRLEIKFKEYVIPFCADSRGFRNYLACRLLPDKEFSGTDRTASPLRPYSCYMTRPSYPTRLEIKFKEYVIPFCADSRGFKNYLACRLVPDKEFSGTDRTASPLLPPFVLHDPPISSSSTIN